MKLSNRLEIHFLTLFPEILEPFLSASLVGKARKKNLVSFHTTQIRDFATDVHHKVDDTPYGGGEGMVLKADVLYRAWESVQDATTKTILLSPQGKILTQEKAKELSQEKKLILVCGHYEGVDERFTELSKAEEISVGDYVLTGGELPALLLADVLTRLLPGVVGNAKSLTEESLENHLLKYPQYTKPREFMGLSVPEVLLSGDHSTIGEWRDQQRKQRTRLKRPDLLKNG